MRLKVEDGCRFPTVLAAATPPFRGTLASLAALSGLPVPRLASKARAVASAPQEVYGRRCWHSARPEK